MEQKHCSKPKQATTHGIKRWCAEFYRQICSVFKFHYDYSTRKYIV